jgi:hypothetical protein
MLLAEKKANFVAIAENLPGVYSALMNHTESSSEGSLITIKDGSNKVVKDLTVTGGTATTITRLGSNFFNGQLTVGYYDNASLVINANDKFRSFTVRLPKGKYSLCSDSEITIIRRKFNGEYMSAYDWAEFTVGRLLTIAQN